MVEMLVIRAFLLEEEEKGEKAVIIGAGQTGRGFVAPILNENNYSITFLDENTSLIYKLQNEKSIQFIILVILNQVKKLMISKHYQLMMRKLCRD